MGALEGVVMELDDCSFELISGIEATSDLKVAFEGTNWALLVGSIPRKAGMEQKRPAERERGNFRPAGTSHRRTRRVRRQGARRRQPV